MPDGIFEGRSAIRDHLGKELAAFSDLAQRSSDGRVVTDGIRLQCVGAEASTSAEPGMSRSTSIE